MSKLTHMLEDIAYKNLDYNDLTLEEKYELADQYLQDHPESWIYDDTIYSDRSTALILDMLRNGHTAEKYYEFENQMKKDIANHFSLEVEELLDREIALKAADDPYIAEKLYHEQPDVYCVRRG